MNRRYPADNPLSTALPRTALSINNWPLCFLKSLGPKARLGLSMIGAWRIVSRNAHTA